jgi:regulator of sigma E protease
MHPSYWLIAILCLTALIVIHEFGHFIVARWCKVKILRFSVGFGPVLYSYTSKTSGTQFAISAIPLGGYVSMLDKSNLTTDDQKQFCLDYKPMWQRFLVVLAGPAANFISAIAFFALAFISGTNDIAPVIGEVAPYSIAYKAGIKPQHEILAINQNAVSSWGQASRVLKQHLDSAESITLQLRALADNTRSDYSLLLPEHLPRGELLTILGITPYMPHVPAKIGTLVSSGATASQLRPNDIVHRFNNQAVNNWQQFVALVQQHPDAQVTLDVERDTINLNIKVDIASKTNKDGEKIGYIGITPPPIDWPTWMLRKSSLPLTDAITNAFIRSYDTVFLIIDSIGMLITGAVSTDQISGPLGITKLMGSSSQDGLGTLLIILAILSINLGLLNLLPIPILDGGHIVFLALELIGGVKLANMIKNISIPFGLALLLLITFLAILNDINNL